MVAESTAQGASLPRGVEACIHTLPESVVSLIPWRPRFSEEAAVPLSGQTTVKGAAVPTRGRLLLATTNWRFLCRAHFFDFGSVAAVDRKLFRSADAWDGFSFAGSPTGEEGESEKLREQRVARGERASCAEKRTGEATYARGRKCESALELRGRASAESPDQAIARGSSSSRCP